MGDFFTNSSGHPGFLLNQELGEKHFLFLNISSEAKIEQICIWKNALSAWQRSRRVRLQKIVGSNLAEA
jgi:hypothetical protein